MTARVSLLLAVFLFTACALQKKIIFIPDSTQVAQQEQAGLSSSWQVIESQSGSHESGRFPAWISGYFDRGIQGVEAMDTYRDKYVFIGKNRGDNFNALQQWANGFTVAQDLPRLIVQRVEQRFVASAALYPDDEYGDYFANTIKKVSDAEYPAAVKEGIFWTKQRRIPSGEETEENADAESENIDVEHYEFLILVIIDREAFQTQINNIMSDIKTTKTPTRDQTTAINKVRLAFFEGF